MITTELLRIITTSSNSELLLLRVIQNYYHIESSELSSKLTKSIHTKNLTVTSVGFVCLAFIRVLRDTSVVMVWDTQGRINYFWKGVAQICSE